MTKPRVILAAILLLAAGGGALASKAHRTALWYYANDTYNAIEVPQACAGTGPQCTTTTAASGPVLSLYSFDGTTYTPALRP